MSDSPQLRQVSQQHSTRCFSSLSPSPRMQGGEEEMQPEGAGSFLQAQLSGHFLLAAGRGAGALLVPGAGLGGLGPSLYSPGPE